MSDKEEFSCKSNKRLRNIPKKGNLCNLEFFGALTGEQSVNINDTEDLSSNKEIVETSFEEKTDLLMHTTPFQTNPVQLINELAKEKDISIEIFNNFAQKECTTNIEKTAFKTAALILKNLMDSSDLPRYVRDMKHLQRMLEGNFYLKRGESGFVSLADQENVIYGGIVYIIRPIKPLGIFKNVLIEIYIGVTWKTLRERFIEHTEDAIESYIINSDWPSRLIEYLILKALETYLTETYSYDSEISPLNDFIENKILGKEKWQKKSEIEKIATILYNTYFHMEVIEAHRNYETAWSREIWNIKNYPLYISGESYQGTLYPNGLNMVISPTIPGYQTLPLYDIIFLISLGYIGPEINKMIREHYHIEINYRTIYSRLNKFWKNWDNILEEFFKPVIQILLEYEGYKWKDIAKSIHRAPSYRIKKNFRKWFFGLNVTQLRYAMNREDFDWNNLGEIAKELKADLADQNTVKGVLIDIWIEWFIKNIGMEEIAKILGYKNVESFRSAWLKQGRVSIFQKKFGHNYTLAVKKYRKKRTVELLIDEDFLDSLLDSRLYWIYVNEFGFMSWEDYAVNKPSQGLRNFTTFFENLFKEEGLTADNLENLTAFNYMENQNIYDIIIEILNS